jgi:hypothetical protein
LTVPESQLKTLSNNKELAKPFVPTSDYYVAQLLKISEGYHEQEQGAGN